MGQYDIVTRGHLQELNPGRAGRTTIVLRDVNLYFLHYISQVTRGVHFYIPFAFSGVMGKSKIPTTDLPYIDGEEYALAALRNGWLYVYNETDDSWREYEVLDDGKLHEVIWGDEYTGKDVRPATGNVVSCVKAKRNKIYRIAFSEVQWSWGFYVEMCSKPGKRNSRMQKIDVNQWVREGEHPHMFSGSRLLSDYDVDCFYDEYQGPLVREAFMATNVDTNTKTFFCLHDPIDIADNLAYNLAEKWLEMEALIQSMQLGLDEYRIYCSILRGENPEDLQDQDKLEEIKSLHSLALLSYQVGLGSDDNKKKLGKHLDKERVEKLLAVEERKRKREEIKAARERLITFLDSNYYQGVWPEYRNNTPERILEGKDRASTHVENINFLENEKDKMLDLPVQGQGNQSDDSGWKHIVKFVEARNETGKVLKENCPIDITDPKFDIKIIKLWNKVLKQVVKIAKGNERYFTLGIQRLNSIQIQQFSVDIFEEITLADYLSGKYQAVSGKTRTITIPEGAKTTFVAGKSGTVAIKQVGFSRHFQQAFRPNSGLYKLAQRLTESMNWRRFVAGLCYLNLAITLYELPGKNLRPNNLEAYKNYAKLVKAMVDAWKGAYDVKILRLTKTGASKVTIDSMKKLSSRATAIGSFIGAAISTYDAGINFYEGDWDAGIAYSVGAVIGVLLGIGALNSWNPVGIILLAVAGVGAGIAAVMLEDPPMERYFKNFPLRKCKVSFSASTPWQLSLEHMTRKNELAKAGFQRWSEYFHALQDLDDMIFGYRVEINKLDTEEYYYEAPNGFMNFINGVARNVGYNVEYPKKIKVVINFRVFFPDISKFEFEFKLYYEGIGDTNNYDLLVPIRNSNGEEVIYTLEDGRVKGEIVFRISDEQFKRLQTLPELFFISRLKLDDSRAYPGDEKRVPRYLSHLEQAATNERIGTSHHGTSFSGTPDYSILYGNNQKIGTKQEIMNYWVTKRPRK